MSTESEAKKPVDDKKRPAAEAESSASLSPKKPKKVKRKHMDPNVLHVRSTIQECCATNDLATAIEVYDKAIQDGTRIEAQSFYNLLNLCDGLGDREIHVGTPKPTQNTAHTTCNQEPPSVREVDLATRQAHASRIKQHMDKLSLSLTETAYTALVKLSCRTKDVANAQALLTEAEGVQQCRPKLRMYAPLLHAFSDMGEMESAIEVWLRLSRQELLPTEKEYIALIQCATKVGDAAVMERVLSDLAEDILVPSRECCHAITNWFESPFATENVNSKSNPATVAILQQIKVPQGDHAANMGPVQCQSNDTWEVSDACRVDPATGVLQTGCLQGEALQPVTLSRSAWREMRAMNETIVTSGRLNQDSSQYQGGRKGPKRKLNDDSLQERQRHWNAFQGYLERKGRLAVVIDGANVGYFEQNFAGAPKHVDYCQIDWVVQHFERLNKSVVLFLHSRHFSPKLLPQQAEPLVQSWRDRGILYQTPHGMNDDWFWMHAALYSGPGTLVLTNDEMRDHHFQMLAPRSFLRWKDRSQVHFSFGDWEKDERGRSLRRRTVQLTYPEIYSRRIQRVKDGLVVPLVKRGDQCRFLDGHIANADGPKEEQYLCIRPKSSIPSS